VTIEAILFDRDQTLLTVDPVRFARLEQHIQALAPKLRLRDIQGVVEGWSGFMPPAPADEPLFWAELLAQLAEPYQIPGDTLQHVQALLAPYYEILVAYPESAAVVQTLRRRGYRLAVFTNTPLPSVEQTLRYGGLNPHWFDVIESRASLGIAKPDPQVFHQLAMRLGVHPAACLVVDDQIGHVEAAQAAGFPAVLIQREPGAAQSSAITSLVALEAMLA
jgi:HAD superfamily hydrolase (TIGR01509 family)